MKLRLNCEQATRLVLLRREQPWAWHQQLALRLHWAACVGCRRLRRQADAMEQAMVRWRAYREGEDG
jgi:hypothetical protein